MSLKAFHLVFITASSALAFGCGFWSLRNYSGADGGAADLVFGLLGLGAGIGLIFYERYFLRKTKNVGYL
jgi:hypothetical protein